MRRTWTLGSILVLLSLVALPALLAAQEEAEAEPYYVYATYSVCDLAEQTIADDIVAKYRAPVFDAAVESGELLSWGWLAHHTGGKWRRIAYHATATLEGALAALDLNEKVAEANPAAMSAYSRICHAHDDYIWRSQAGSSAGPEARGDAGFSVYYVCDEAQESRADELMRDVLAPVYDRHVAEGRLGSWGWMEHWVGGEFRRLATMTGADHATVLATRNAIIEELVGEHEEAMDEFTSICGSHRDYMWDVQLETP